MEDLVKADILLLAEKPDKLVNELRKRPEVVAAVKTNRTSPIFDMGMLGPRQQREWNVKLRVEAPSTSEVLAFMDELQSRPGIFGPVLAFDK